MNPDVLIPRPETEFLVEKALELIEASVEGVEIVESPTTQINLADLGTGRWAIAIALANQNAA